MNPPILSMNPCILIPAYQPTHVLIDLVHAIKNMTSSEVLIVNDGSSAQSSRIFAELEGLNGVTVIHHAVNRGKGEALKTGINHFLLHSAENCPGIVTADADGQHLSSDVGKIAEVGARSDDLVLGCRVFSRVAPLRSRLGNIFTLMVFRALIGQKLSDTQTGLRFLPRRKLPEFLKITYGGYEYELAMLIETVRSGEKIHQVPIETVYIDNNTSSHFDPIKDSLRIYFVFLRFAGVAIATAFIDFAIFAAVFPVLGSVFGSIFLARLIAGTFNFFASKRLVFKSSDSIIPEITKYICLVFFLMLMSWVLTETIDEIIGGNILLAKGLAEGGMFIASFAIQRTLIFGHSRA